MPFVRPLVIWPVASDGELDREPRDDGGTKPLLGF